MLSVSLVCFSSQPLLAKDPTYLDTRQPVPGHIEFENFVSVNGTVRTIETPRYEAGLGESITRMTNNASANYSVNVAETGNYEIKIRFSRSGTGSPALELLAGGRNGTRIIRTTIPGSGSTDNFQTITLRNVRLTAGNQTIAAKFTGGNGAFNGTILNWMAFKLQPSSASPQFQLYVSPTGNDGANGSSGSPYRTVKRAFDRIKQINQSNPNHGPITVWLREGYHEISSRLNLNGNYSGTARGPVTVQAFGNENAIIGGGRRINPSSFRRVTDSASLNRLKENARNNVFRVRLNDSNWRSRFVGGFHEGMISYNGKALMRATFPNKGLDTVTNIVSSGNSFKTTTPINATRWRNEFNRSGDMVVLGHLRSDEFGDTATVTSVNADGRIVIDSNDLDRAGRKLRVVNVLAELDMPGEWYYDRISNDLYLWPVASLNLNPEIRVGGSFIMINTSDVNYWTFRNIKFQDNGGDNTFSGPNELIHWRGDNCLFGGCHFRNSSARVTARFVGRFNTITGCDFYDSGSPFVVSGGSRTLPVLPSQTEFTNNRVYDVTNRGYGGGGIGGDAVRFANNLITNVQAGNTYSSLSDGLLELNEWYDVGYEQGDWNVAYVGATFASWGTVVRHNFVHNMVRPPGRRRAGAFRADDGAAGLNIVGNIFYKTGDYTSAIRRTGSTYTNNIAIETFGGLLTGAPGTDTITGKGGSRTLRILTPAQIRAENAAQQAITASSTREKVNYIFNTERDLGQTDFWQTPYFAYKYPIADRAFDTNPYDTVGMEVRRNYIANVERPVDTNGTGFSLSQLVEDSDNPISISKNSFVNLNTLDLRFKSNFSPVSGFYNIPFEKVGLVTDEFRPIVPHKATYRANAKLKWNFSKSNSAGRRANPATDNNVYPDPTFNHRVVYDLGSYTSPLFPLATLVTPQTRGTYGWTNTGGLSSFVRSSGNALNRDIIFSRQTKIFQRVVENGDWYALITFGDSGALRDRMNVRVAGGTFESGNRNFNTASGSFVNKFVKGRVTNGRFRIEISDSGGSNADWSVSRIIIQNTPFGGQSPLPNSGGGGGGNGGGGPITDAPQTTSPTNTGSFVNAENYRWDFGTNDSPLFNGYSRITSNTNQGYARWNNTSSLASRDRGGSNNSLNRDFVFSRQARIFQQQIANGSYNVTLNLFDGNHRHDNMQVRAEGIVKLSNQTFGGNAGNTTQNFPVTVTDGRLDIEFSDQGGSDPNWVANRLVITRTGDASPGGGGGGGSNGPFSFDFGTSGSPLQAGAIRVSPNTRSGSFRWLNGVNAVDRGASAGINNFNRDLIFSSASRDFEITGLSNGNWRVAVTLGDALFPHNQMNVRTRGGAIFSNTDTVRSEFKTADRTQNVTDGKIVITFSDGGGSDVNWVATRVVLTKL